MIRRVVLAENAPAEKRASTRRIEASALTCQYCHKIGHTADKCWQINKFQGTNNFREQNKSGFSQNKKTIIIIISHQLREYNEI